ncbi:SAM hydrolase/SAM-dependent halogenase family protein [Thermosulfuriphilus sp.]
MPIITLTTDFGLRDSYVAEMKGVILSLCPQVTLVDATHEISPQDIVEGALVLASFYRFYPAGTIHLAVVDPGVGGPRRPIVVQAGGHLFVGPDNGLFALVLQREGDFSAYEIRHSDYLLPEISTTFHGRDVFAPVAAHLARGLDPQRLGPLLEDLVRLDFPLPRKEGHRIIGQVIHVDHFGNLVTNIPATFLESLRPSETVVEIAGRRILGLKRTYIEVPPGVILALVGSHGFLEIAANQTSAATTLEAGRGARVLVHQRPPQG